VKCCNYFFLPGCESSSGFHSGTSAEMSNSGASAFATADLASGCACATGAGFGEVVGFAPFALAAAPTARGAVAVFGGRGFRSGRGYSFPGICGGRTEAQRSINRGSQVHQHAQRLTGRILSLEHNLPRLADHAQPHNRLLRRELGSPAVDGLDSFFFQFGKPVENVVEIGEHEAEEDAPHEVSKNE